MVAGQLIDSLAYGRPGARTVITPHLDSLDYGKPGAVSVITHRLARNLRSIMVTWHLPLANRLLEVHYDTVHNYSLLYDTYL